LLNQTRRESHHGARSMFTTIAYAFVAHVSTIDQTPLSQPPSLGRELVAAFRAIAPK
jgi:hypothetical protein